MADLQPPSMLSMTPPPANDGGVNQFLSLEKSALDSGQVSPQDVQNAQIVMNQPDGMKKLQKSLGVGPKDMNLIPAPLRAAMSQMGASGKGKQSKGTVKDTTDTKMGSTRNVTDTDQLSDNMNAIQQNPFIASQMEDINKSQNALSMRAANTPNGGDSGWVRPLLALSDAQNGTNMAQSYVGPEQRQAQQLAAQDQLDKRKEALTKLIFEGVKNAKIGTDTTQQNNQLMQELGRIEGTINNGADRGQIAEDNRAFRAHSATVQAINKDPQLKERMTQYNNLGNSLSILANADTVTPQQLDEAQQSIRANLGIKGTGGVDERDRTRLNDVMLDVKRSLQKVTGKPQDVGADNAILAHVKNLANVERANVQAVNDARLNQVSQGQNWVYEDPVYGPKYKPSLDKLLNAAKASYTAPVPAKQMVKAPSSKYPSGRPDATWNEAQLDAFKADHGG